MTTRGLARALAHAGALVLLSAAPAAADTVPVGIAFQTFAPADVDVLPGDTVEWANGSERRHTVASDDGSFGSGDLFTGDRFEHEFDAVGAYSYHCTVHLGMTGDVDVRRVLLDPAPPAAVPAGAEVELTGRSADAAPVTVEQDAGDGFHPVATVLPGGDGHWSVAVAATATSDYRAVNGGDVSRTRRLLVSDRKVRVAATARGVRVTVTPRAPGARVRLQVRSREHFGWFPVALRRLDYLSRADFRVRRPARVRAVLVDRDTWTPVATSPDLKLPPPR